MKKVKMINSLFGNEMWVAEDRVEEYKEAGHRLAASASTPAEKPKKVASRKTTSKKTTKE
ncbi:MAG: hypothetical protein MJ128_05265 [Mogibacterium sp.]|nr:hypothetical protein [Mogibacterium sp.]